MFTPTTGSGYSGSTGTASFTVNPVTSTTTSLSASPNSPQFLGTNVTLTATVSPSAAPGIVQFQVNGTNIGGPVTVSGGTAHLQTSSLPAGTDQLKAEFVAQPGSGFAASTGSLTYTVKGLNDTSVSLSSSANPSQLGVPVTFTATVTDPTTPTGTLTFSTGGQAIAGCATLTLDDNAATCTTTFSTPGSYTVTAAYSGDAISSGSSASLTQVVGHAGRGYWIVGSDGSVHNYGDGSNYGSEAGTRLNAPIVGDGVHARRQGLLAGRRRRRHLHLRRRRLLRLDGRPCT